MYQKNLSRWVLELIMFLFSATIFTSCESYQTKSHNTITSSLEWFEYQDSLYDDPTHVQHLIDDYTEKMSRFNYGYTPTFEYGKEVNGPADVALHRTIIGITVMIANNWFEQLDKIDPTRLTDSADIDNYYKALAMYEVHMLNIRLAFEIYKVPYASALPGIGRLYKG